MHNDTLMLTKCIKMEDGVSKQYLVTVGFDDIDKTQLILKIWDPTLIDQYQQYDEKQENSFTGGSIDDNFDKSKGPYMK